MEQLTASSSTTNNAAGGDIQETTSPNFPDGYGDITLITIDNVIFHVHRAVLRHSSHVFETIFENGEGDDDTSCPPRIKMEAEAATLDRLLAFAYPNKLSPSIQDINLLAAVFRAAKRYEMDGVLQQLSKSLSEARIVGDVIDPPLYIKAPLAVLAVSHAFDCTEAGRFALRECIKGSLGDHIAGVKNFDVPLELLSEVFRLRQTRIDSFIGQGEWRVQIIRDLTTCPRADRLRQAISTPIGNCITGHLIGQMLPQVTLDSWINAAVSLEEKLPVLPQLSR